MNLFGLRPSGPIDWPSLHALVQKGQFAAVVDALRGLDEAQRAELGKQLVAVRRDAGSWFNEKEATAYAVAAVGCASTAAKAVTVIARHGWPWSTIRSQPVLRAAADRGVPWLGDLAARLAARLPRDPTFASWQLTADLLLAAGAPAPTGERFVDGWLLSVRVMQRDKTVLGELRASPFTDALLPLAFERDAIASSVGVYDQVTREWQTGPGVLLAVAALVGEGRFDRATALDRCLDVLLGTRPKMVLHGFVQFHDALAPTGAEVAERATIYLKLLADATGSAATMAQKVLKDADAAGTLELESLLDASRTVLGRSEKGLVKAQLIWLEKLAKRLPARAAEIAEVVAVAVEHPDVQLRDRAAAFLARHGHADAHGSPGGALVAERLPDLLPGPVPAADMPEPIVSPDELAEEVAALDQAEWQTVPVERVLAGLVRLHAGDPVALRAALAPVLQRMGDRIGASWWVADSHREAGALFTAALNKAAGLPFLLAEATRVLRGTPADVRIGNPYVKLHGVLMLRLAEVVVRLSTEPVPALVATPTQVNGLLDPAALVERLARAEREGWQPWKRDLRQALYRLPLHVDADVLRQARTLHSEAGRALVDWMDAGGTGRPEIRVVRVHRQRTELGRNVEWLPESRFYAASAPARSAVDPYWLTELTAPQVVNGDLRGHDWAALWPSVLPSQREVVAACLLPVIASATDVEHHRGDARLLPLLAELDGPVGAATLTAIAYGLAASQADQRIAALDALVAVGGLEGFDGAELGAQLARMAGTKLIVLSRAVTQLEEASRIAPAMTWQVAAGALAGLLPAEHTRPSPGPATTPAAQGGPGRGRGGGAQSAHVTPRGLPDLLTLATTAAAASGSRGDVPGLTELSARTGSTRLVVEAKRLHRTLAAH
ncbi:DUF6493 family protein [Dactylosporangium sp. NBC_01737]|uniref:DUF6493 family protein n=1 Tax=Dactylosporangium sp. NBC_01737 TaxID=2975959 RepID=UPI002E0EB302|nr:DUF6493 family protein [Dactylosporangium sp. NBC_01737]